VDRIRPRYPRDPDVLIDLQVSFDRPLTLTDEVGLVGLEPVQRQLVLFGIGGDGLDVQFIGSAKHPDSDFAAVGDKDLLDRHRFWPEGKGFGRVARP
jgi:hypothetical protein